MKISVSFSDKHTAEHTLNVTKKLAEGKFTIYQVYSPAHRTNFALKIFPKDHFGTTQYQNEKRACNLTHTNIIKHIPMTYTSSKFHALLFELAPFGDFLQLITTGILDTEELIRTYFHQIIEGLEHMHSNGVAHLDLKLQNLVMDSDYTLKIIDFDQVQQLTDTQLISGGTTGFRAPEVMTGTCKDFAAADIYSAGIILFTFMSNEYPFAEVNDGESLQLKYYSTFMRENSEFWKSRAEKQGDENFFSRDFIELINGMLEFDPSKRFDIQQIKESKWYNGLVLDSARLRQEMGARMSILMGEKNQM